MSQPKIAHYQLQARLGQGAMGVVFRAFDERLEREVAIKLLQVALDQSEAADYAARLLQEARSAARLNHPGIITVYDCGAWRGKSYLAMELVQGVTLKALLDQRGALKIGEVHNLARQIFAALAHAHAHGVVHRDIKPANLMLTRDARLKITDFGIAQLPASDLTKTGMVLGSPRYMAPEQLSGSKLDGRADVYSAGVVLYQALTGLVPFDGEHPMTIAYNVLHSQPQPPHQINNEIPRWLSELVLRCLAKQPAARFASADEALNALLQGATGTGEFAASASQPVMEAMAATEKTARPADPPAAEPISNQAAAIASAAPASPFYSWLLQSGTLLAWLAKHGAKGTALASRHSASLLAAGWRRAQYWTPVMLTGARRSWRQSYPYRQATQRNAVRAASWSWTRFSRWPWQVQLALLVLVVAALAWLVWPRAQQVEVMTAQEQWVESNTDAAIAPEITASPQALRTQATEHAAPKKLPTIKLSADEQRSVDAAELEARNDGEGALLQGAWQQLGQSVRQAAAGVADCWHDSAQCKGSNSSDPREARR